MAAEKCKTCIGEKICGIRVDGDMCSKYYTPKIKVFIVTKTNYHSLWVMDQDELQEFIGIIEKNGEKIISIDQM